MSSIFEKNIKALLTKEPELASKIFAINTNKNFEVVQQGDDLANINIIDKQKAYPIYKTSPMKEIEQKQKEFKKYERYPVLFFYGIGNGIFIKLLLANSIRKKIIVFEPNLEILYIVFNLIDFSEEIENEKIKFLLPQDITYSKIMDILVNPDIYLFLKTYELHIYSDYYEKFFAKNIKELNKLIIRGIKQAIINVGNDTIDTLIGIEHHIQNIPEMLKNPYFQQLKNKKISDVAIIASTGPSLIKQLPLLKEIQNYVTIIAPDASFPILEKNNIKPDIITSLERVEDTAKFFEKTSKDFQKDVLKIHASLQHKKVLENSHGKKILVMRPFRYSRYFNLHKYGYLGIGMSAANMAYELAYFMGYKTIVLIGQDLAYSKDGKSHAKGHVYGENEIKSSQNDLLVTAYGGNGLIQTTKTWLMFKNFFEKDIEDTKKEDVITINATEGGARIEGAIEMPFKEVIDKYIKKEPKKSLKLRKIKNIDKKLLNSYTKVIKAIEYGEKVEKEIEKVFLKVAKAFDELVELNKKNKLEKINFDKLIKLSDRIDKIKSKIESKKFSLIFGETIQSYLVNKELDLAKIQVQNPQNEIEKKAKIVDWIMNHKEWLFMLAGSINAQIIVMKRAIKNLEDELQKRHLLTLQKTD